MDPNQPTNILRKEKKCKCQATSGERGTYKCSFCGFRTSRVNSLKIHEALHSKRSRYQCKKCSYSAMQWKHLKNHLMFHHLDLQNNQVPLYNPFFCVLDVLVKNWFVFFFRILKVAKDRKHQSLIRRRRKISSAIRYQEKGNGINVRCTATIVLKIHSTWNCTKMGINGIKNSSVLSVVIRPIESSSWFGI